MQKTAIAQAIAERDLLIRGSIVLNEVSFTYLERSELVVLKKDIAEGLSRLGPIRPHCWFVWISKVRSSPLFQRLYEPTFGYGLRRPQSLLMFMTSLRHP